MWASPTISPGPASTWPPMRASSSPAPNWWSMAAIRRAEMAGGLAALLRAVLVWTLFIAAESAQGTLRRVLLTPEMQLAARGAGVLIGSVLIVALTWATWRWLGLRRARTA